MRKYVKPVSELVSICMNENIAQSAAFSMEGRFTFVSDGNGNLKTSNIAFQPLLSLSNDELMLTFVKLVNSLGEQAAFGCMKTDKAEY